MCAKLNGDTQRKPVLLMLQQHVALQVYVAELDSLMLTAAMNLQLDILIKKVQEFKDVVLRLQESLCTLRQTQAYFESVLEVYTTL